MRIGARVPFTPIYASGRVPGTGRRRSRKGELDGVAYLLFAAMMLVYWAVRLVWRGVRAAWRRPAAVGLPLLTVAATVALVLATS